MAHLGHAPRHREAHGKIKCFQSTHGIKLISRTVTPNPPSGYWHSRGLTAAPSMTMQIPTGHLEENMAETKSLRFFQNSRPRDHITVGISLMHPNKTRQ